MTVHLGQLVDAADPSTWPAGYSPEHACPFPQPHGFLGQTNMPFESGFQIVCNTHLDQALLTVAAPTATVSQQQPRCSGCTAGPALSNPHDIAASYPTLQTFGFAEVPQVKACTEHAILALTALLEAS